MRIKITDSYHQELIDNKKNILYYKTESRFCAIMDFEVEEIEVEKKHWFKPNEIIKKKYLTKLSVAIYDTNENLYRILSDEKIELAFVYLSITKLRKNWLDLKEQLIGFGLNRDFTHKKEVKFKLGK